MSPTPSPQRRPRRLSGLRLAALAVPAVLLTSGCDAREAYERALYFGMPDPATDRAENIYELWLGSNAAAVIVGVFVYALILFAAVRYRKRSDELPRQVRYNLPIEVLYTVVPLVIVSVLFFYTTVSQNFVNQLSDDDEGGADINIAVIGFQWNWTFNYLAEPPASEDALEEAPVFASVTGTPFQPAQLILPTGRTVRFYESSPDVIHSFWVPEFLFKRDVIPGRINTFELTPKKEGTYIGRCAEFCGEKHARMNFAVKVVSPEEYDDFLDSVDGAQASGSTAAGTTATQPAGSSS